MAKFRAATNRLAGARSNKRAVSGPALVVLALTLAAIWFGSQALNQTATESFDTKPAPQPAEQPAPSEPTDQPATATPPPATALESSTPDNPASSLNAGALPAGFPAVIPVPSNATLINATVAGEEGDKNYIAAYQIAAKPSDVNTSYQQQLKDAGFEVHAVLGTADSGFFGAQKDTLSMTVSVGADQQAPDKTNLTLTTSGR